MIFQLFKTRIVKRAKLKTSKTGNGQKVKDVDTQF